MRRIKMPASPPSLDEVDSTGRTERERAIAHFTAPDWQQQEAARETRFRFDAYRHPTVRQALEFAFAGLCAYCETPYPAGSDTNVEHYRPKGAVDTATQSGQQPGYYWLASDWHNLLPSCTRCNQPRRLEHADGNRRRGGKGNAFPLEVEADRATAAGEEVRERALLLHPYDDDPDEHLEFVADGVVRPRDGSKKGRATIDVLGLNRRVLVDARRGYLRTVEAALIRMTGLRELQASYPDDPRFESLLAEDEEELAMMIAHGSPYAALVAQRLQIDTTSTASDPAQSRTGS
jgi:uncharacterized protein (TIGR02646 family)